MTTWDRWLAGIGGLSLLAAIGLNLATARVADCRASPFWEGFYAFFGVRCEPKPPTRHVETPPSIPESALATCVWPYGEKGQTICEPRPVEIPATAGPPVITLQEPTLRTGPLTLSAAVGPDGKQAKILVDAEGRVLASCK